MNARIKTGLILFGGVGLLLMAAFARRDAPAPLGSAPTASPSPTAPTGSIFSGAFTSAFADAAKLPASPALLLGGNLSHPSLASGADREVFLQATLAPDLSRIREESRSPVQLALVIDCSGSMAGPKLDNSKRAARQVVQLLRDGDRVVVVGYSDYARTIVRSTVIDAAARASVEQAIEAMYVNGSTNLSAGIDQAARELVADSGADHSTRRIVLLSDGQANMGEVRQPVLFATASALRNRGIGLSAMGVGTDFNAPLMEGLAEHGGGRFRFLADPDQIADAFMKELRLAARLIASDVKVVLRPADGVKIEQVYGFGMERVGRDVVVRVPDISASTEVMVVARLSVSARTTAFPVVDLVTTFAEVATDRTRVASPAHTVSATLAASAADEQNALNRDVFAQGLAAKSAEDARLAMELYEKGNREEAIQALDRATASANSANTGLKSKTLADAASEFVNLRGLFAASANALGAEEQEANRRGIMVQRKAIRNFGSNDKDKE